MLMGANENTPANASALCLISSEGGIERIHAEDHQKLESRWLGIGNICDHQL